MAGVASGPSTVPSITPLQQVVSSCSGALLTSLLTTPFDVVRVRLQAQQAILSKPCYLMDCRCLDGVSLCYVTPEGRLGHYPKLSGTFDAFLKIARFEGVRSWWKGLPPTLLMAVPATVIYYTCYDQLKVHFGFHPKRRNFLAPMIAGSLARTVAVVAISPIELIRTKVQSRYGYSYKEVWSIVYTVVRKQGILSLWRGMSPMLLRDIPFSIAFWVGYEYLKIEMYSFIDPHYYSLVPFISGCASGTVAALLTNPLDVVKTHMQVDLGEPNRGLIKHFGSGSVMDVMKNVVNRHGFSGLYTGMAPRIAKIAPACAIMISTYEAFKKYFAYHNQLV